MSVKELYKLFLACNAVSTDSRNIQQKDLFIALKGPNFNGNKYAATAIQKGALYAVVDDKEFKENEKYIVVEDTLKCLQDLATYHRDQFDIPFIAIAGSNGKTTTKELIKEVLATSFITYATPGNFNNEIGVPLTLLNIKSNTEMAVIEMGAKNIGDIKELCDIAHPTHGIITNTGKDHLDTFKTVENTLKTNAELYSFLSNNNGTAFVNIGDEQLMQKASIVNSRITYGRKPGADCRGEIEINFPYVKIRLASENKSLGIQSQLTGKYNFENIIAAIAVGNHFGVPDQLVKKAIEGYAPTNNRSQIMESNSNVVILDAYNANPSSMKEAVDNLASIKSSNKIAILGDMLELGEASFEEHLLLVIYLKSLHFNQVVLVGDEFRKVKDKIDCQHFSTVQDAKDWYDQQHIQNATILLKGSRKIALEKLFD